MQSQEAVQVNTLNYAVINNNIASIITCMNVLSAFNLSVNPPKEYFIRLIYIGK